MKIYLAELGRPALFDVLTDLFAPAPSESIDSVAEQERFYKACGRISFVPKKAP
ncbi:hypothetical protein [Leptospira weilii]|nr:hypothetical protein [Leptospira weilii]MCL8267587.1 hypothetical protein [Leptospira weilii]ULH30809.1 hypothetical protein FH586_21250 [Leptospira weilii]